MTKFTVEETNLICIFDTSSRRRAIVDMKNISLNDLDDEMQELLYRTVTKLEKMTDEEFSRISFTPADITDERSE
jgi:hypothetical protein